MCVSAEPVRISGFATFYTKDVKERVRRNPFTGGEIVCPANKKPKVRFSKRFKDYLK
jgi:nucleoid DNA-binding protein